MNYPEIISRMFNTPLMLHPAKADIIARAFGPRILGHETVDVRGGEEMGIVGDQLGEVFSRYGETRDMTRRVGDVAILEIEGSLINKGRWIGKSSGQTSYEGIMAQANALADDPTARGVIFEVDSFGGEVSGAYDCAEVLFELSQIKPTMAVLTDHACSAGYLLASAARSIVIPVNGIAGSIGVVQMHFDFSGMLKKDGVAVTILSAGAHKKDGNPYEPLPAAFVEKQLAELEELREEFAATVARYRAGRLTKDAALATEAQTYRGQQAVDAGLADAVARPSQVLAAFQAELDRAAA